MSYALAALPLPGRSPLIALATLAALLPRPASLHAQSLAAELFASRSASLTSSSIWGGALTVGEALAVRVGGGVGYGQSDAGATDGSNPITAYAADLDLLLAPGAASQPRAYGFVGVGSVGRTDGYGAAWERGTTLSTGGGLMIPLLEVLSLDGSARYRIPAGDSTGFRGGFPRGMEYRVGVALRFGGSSSRGSSGGARGGSGVGGIFWPTGASSAGGSAAAARVLPTAERYLGVPYRWGGEDPATGFDCSGFTQYVYRRHGVTLPRTSREQARVGTRLPVELRALAPGDMIFFAADGERIDHVAIYAGNDRIIHATASGNEVRYDDLRTQRGAWFVNHMVAARRVMDDGGSLVRGLIQSLGLQFDSGDRAPRP